MKKESENAVDTKQNADGIKQNNKREKGALVRLTYVASGRVVKRSLNMNNEEKKVKTLSTRSETRTARSRTR
ncbi:hypothetical protein T02_2757 [Trichinella nativa]|uniref:Uncharacterized protein n=1 Tax=Trichinella nativa TaxID=6335 RepID=A0A0V1KN31_9BILA|nr:hypothetical protein T02_2757 [Trichinella nativa]